MRVLAITTSLVVMLFAAAPAVAYEGDYTKEQKQSCKLRGANGRWSRAESRDVERCVSKYFDRVGTAKMLQVAACESGHNAYAVSESGTFRGLFQHHEGYWPERVRSAQRVARRLLGDGLRTGVFNARSNAFVTAVMVQRSNSWGAWSCA